MLMASATSGFVLMSEARLRTICVHLRTSSRARPGMLMASATCGFVLMSEARLRAICVHLRHLRMH